MSSWNSAYRGCAAGRKAVYWIFPVDKGLEVSFGSLAVRAAASVDPERLSRRIGELARFGARSDGGVDRQALTAAELAARRWLVSDVVRRPGYRLGIDEAANVFLQRQGTAAETAVLTGSHLDTQPTGGRLDGAFGVVAGFELLDVLDGAGIRTRRPIEVVVWSNEEGCRFAPGLMGSNAFAQPGRLTESRVQRDADGVDFGSACDAARRDLLLAASDGGWPLMDCPLARPLHAYLEAHIEQGPELEAAHCQVGCVDSIQGVRWLEFKFFGRSAHAGSTPAHLRDDAMVAAIDAAHQVQSFAAAQALRDPRLRVTVGRFEVLPNSINTIANEVTFTVDLRHPAAATLEMLQVQITAMCTRAAALRTLLDKPPVSFDTRLHQLTLKACHALGITHRPMLSGAFHDAMPLAAHAPTAMLFAPSRGGLSHHPAEDTDLDDLVACTRALALCITDLALEH